MHLIYMYLSMSVSYVQLFYITDESNKYSIQNKIVFLMTNVPEHSIFVPDTFIWIWIP